MGKKQEFLDIGEILEASETPVLPGESDKSSDEKDTNKDTDFSQGGGIDINKFFEDTDNIDNIDDSDQDLNKKDKDDKEDDERDEKDSSKAPSLKDKKSDDEKGDDKSDENLSQVPFYLFKSLSEEGALESFDEEEFKKEVEENGIVDAVQNAWRKEYNYMVEQIREEQEEDFKEYAELKDLEIDTDVAKRLMSAKIQFESIDPEDIEGEDKEDLRREILFTNFKNSTRFSDTKIGKLIEGIIEKGSDVEEAKEALGEIKDYNKEQIKLVKEAKKKEEEDKIKNRDRIVKSYREFISNFNEPIKDVKINKSTKNKLEKNVMSGYMWQLRRKDPVRFDTVVTYYLMNDILSGKFDKAKNAGKTEAATELQKIISTTKKSDSKPSTQYTKENEQEDDLLMKGLKTATKSRSSF